MPPPQILFEDSEILVLDKPAGMVVDKSETQQVGTVEDWLEESGGTRSSTGTPPGKGTRFAGEARREREKLERQGIVHRLDKDTSGVLLVAKTQTALENLQTQFASRATKKEYICLVHGTVEKPGKIEGAIGRNPRDREKFIVLDGGKEASTEYETEKLLVMSDEFIEKIFPDYSKIQLKKLRTMNYELFNLLSCHPLTGRTHQIRVHLKHIGFPIVGDEKYVGRKMSRLDKRWCPRQFLHAAKLGFNHPKTGEWMEVESKLPEDLQQVLEKLTSELAN